MNEREPVSKSIAEGVRAGLTEVASGSLRWGLSGAVLGALLLGGLGAALFGVKALLIGAGLGAALGGFGAWVVYLWLA